MLGPEIVVPVAFFASIVVVVIGRPLIKAVAAKAEAEARNPQLPTEIMNRFERMEQSLDAIAVEVERISEGQRFTTKLLSEVRDSATVQIPARSSAPPSSQ
jgi:D-ribose pyranose/furanose isomerase RbsD